MEMSYVYPIRETPSHTVSHVGDRHPPGGAQTALHGETHPVCLTDSLVHERFCPHCLPL